MLSEALDLGVAIAGTLGGAEQIIQTRLAGEVDARVATTPAVSLVQAAARRLAEAGPDTLGEALSELHGALEGLEALDRPR